jgi:ADP-glucose pyrophosphorylase
VISEGCQVSNSLIMKGAVLEPRCVVKGSIIGPKVVVGRDSQVSETILAIK